MPLTSFESVPQPVVAPLKPLKFRIVTPDVAESAEVANQAMRELGLAGPDNDKNLEELSGAFNALTTPGYDGRLHVLPGLNVPFAHILQTAEGKRPDGVSENVFFDPWVPDTSYTNAELNKGPAGHMARLALFNSQDTGFDPILHSLNVPFDNYKDEHTYVNRDGIPTQLDELEEDRQAVAARHEGYTLDGIDHRAFVMMALMDRIRGVKFQEQILSAGFMRVDGLGRRAVRDLSFVGIVGSDHGRLCFSGNNGCAHPGVGVGRSLGLNEA